MTTTKHSSTINDYGTDDEGVRRVYINRGRMSIEVEGGARPLTLTLHHFPGQRRPRDISHKLDVLSRRTFDGAIAVATALVEGRETASANRTGDAA